MASESKATIALWIALATMLLGIPSALLAWSQLTADDGPGETTTNPAGPTTTAGGSTEEVTTTTAATTSTSTAAQTGDALDVSNCTIEVTHFAAQIHDEPDHRGRVLSAVPEGTHRPSAAALADWAGREELWFQLTVDGRTGWLNDNPIVLSKSSGCP